MTTLRDPTYAGYRFPAELIAYAVWLYFRFPLSLRMEFTRVVWHLRDIAYGFDLVIQYHRHTNHLSGACSR